jgi:hypothetical protein
MGKDIKHQGEDTSIEPETVFSRPLDVLVNDDLNHEQKSAALERWKEALQDRLRATGEGMAPPAGETAREAALIEEIGKALKLLTPDPLVENDRAM